ncbi:hypothetical protein AGOR_G00215920 [Albula goreensis]|uniref:Uncharacterized protein n=1 Tax=Albula goreensis TaxID=1534307 RepID=A0A8T3CP50_9TELE|nr:hypothetical protein AGOR_G00215920 [Albula goreensis]
MMNVSWIAVILLPFSQLFFAKTGDSVSCPALPSTVIHHLTTNDSVFVRCPNVTGDEITFRLHNCNGSTKVVKWKDNTTQNEDGAEFEIQGPSRPSRFKLSQLFVNSTGLYYCEAEVLYPPPYSKIQGEHTLILVEEVPEKVDCPKGCPKVSFSPLLVWLILGVSVLILYSVIMTGITGVLWYKLRNKQNLQHDYMNMKPRAAKKKQGVQHPIRTGRY